MSYANRYRNLIIRKDRLRTLLHESYPENPKYKEPVKKKKKTRPALDSWHFLESVPNWKYQDQDEVDLDLPEWQRVGIKDFRKQKAVDRADSKKADFIYSMSYGKSCGFISRHPSVMLYNGSSYNRKPTEKKEIIELSEEEEINNAYNLYKYTPSYGLYKHDTEYLNSKKKKSRNVGLSKRTKEKITDKLLALYRACSGKKGYRAGVVDFTFVTLTFIDKINDQDAIDLLDNFLNRLRKYYGKRNYLWVAERQKDTKNIHFHLIIDCKLPIEKINAMWVLQQVNAGLVNDQANNKVNFIYGKNFKQLYKERQYKKIQEFLNPCDMKKVTTIDGISCYLTNYVLKNDTVIKGSQWNSSTGVSRLFTKKIIGINQFMATGDSQRNNIVNKKTGRLYVNQTYYGEWCTINTIYNKQYYKSYLSDLEEINKMILGLNREDKLPDRKDVMNYVEIPKKEYRKMFFANYIENETITEKKRGNLVIFKKSLEN